MYTYMGTFSLNRKMSNLEYYLKASTIVFLFFTKLTKLNFIVIEIDFRHMQ